MSGALITYWEPEDTRSWDRQGSRIARRNLWISILCLILAFSTWVIWSIVVLKMPTLGFPYSKAKLFMLTALPSLSGATLRMVYSFLPAMVLVTFCVLGFLPGRLSDGTLVGGNFWGFFLIFQLLFLLSGIGNGSVFRMIPVVFAALSLREAKGDGEAAQREARLHGVTESAAALASPVPSVPTAVLSFQTDSAPR